MEKIATAADLKNAITILELNQAREWPLLKEQFLLTYESLKPLNVLKKTLKDFTVSTPLKDKVLNVAIGGAAGLISKFLVVGASKNPVRNLFGIFLQTGVSALITKNPEIIKILSDKVMDLINTVVPQKETNDTLPGNNR